MPAETDQLLLARTAAVVARIERATRGGTAAGEFLPCQTVQIGATYPTTAAKYYGVRRLAESGVEVEGGAVALVMTGSAFLAAHVGTKAPPLGSKVRVFRDHPSARWVFTWD